MRQHVYVELQVALCPCSRWLPNHRWGCSLIYNLTGIEFILLRVDDKKGKAGEGGFPVSFLIHSLVPAKLLIACLSLQVHLSTQTQHLSLTWKQNHRCGCKHDHMITLSGATNDFKCWWCSGFQKGFVFWYLGPTCFHNLYIYMCTTGTCEVVQLFFSWTTTIKHSQVRFLSSSCLAEVQVLF